MIALDFTTFLGRFHPIFVHLPIGFLVLAIILEWYQTFRNRRKKTKKTNSLIAVSWFIGGISAFAAALCGWLLAESGSYSEDNLFAHRWLGIALVAFALTGWWIKKNHEKYSMTVHNLVNFALLAVLMIEGHKGGNLTHGEDYLVEYAPEPIQRLFGSSSKDQALPQYSSPDSVLVYADLISPIMDIKCISCHNDEVQRGGLNISSPQFLQEGGENGPVIAPGDTDESEIFRRITISQENSKFMPPKGNPMSYDEIKVMEWWISNGADFEKKVAELEIPESIRPSLLRLYGLDTEPKPWYESVVVSPIDSTQLELLSANGFTIKSLGEQNNLLDIKYAQKNLGTNHLQVLNGAKDHITWLSLAQSNVTDELLSSVGSFANLTRLQLEKTAISDQGIAALTNLEHLEVLNIYETNVTDSCLQDLLKIKSLKRVYLWKTAVTENAITSVQDENPDLEFILGN